MNSPVAVGIWFGRDMILLVDGTCGCCCSSSNNNKKPAAIYIIRSCTLHQIHENIFSIRQPKQQQQQLLLVFILGAFFCIVVVDFFCASFRKFGCIQIHSSSFFRTPRQTHNHTHTVIRSTRGAMQSIISERTYWIRLLMWIIWVARCERKIGAHVWYDVYNPVYCMRMPTTRFDEMNRCDTLQSFRNVYTLHSLHAVHGGHVTSESRTVSITPSHDGNENTIAWYMNYFIRSSITCFDFEYY